MAISLSMPFMALCNDRLARRWARSAGVMGQGHRALLAKCVVGPGRASSRGALRSRWTWRRSACRSSVAVARPFGAVRWSVPDDRRRRQAAELKKLPLVGWFLERYPMILVDRSAGRQALRQMVDEARRAVGEGRKVLLFPQGTRQAIDEPMTFQSPAFPPCTPTWTCQSCRRRAIPACSGKRRP